MYTITANGQAIYDSLEDRGVATAEYNAKANMASSLTLKLYPTHPLYDQIHRLSTVIEAKSDDAILFRGRVLNESVDFDGLKTLLCEGELAYLVDSIVRPYDWHSGGVEAYLNMLITQHNTQVEVDRRITLRTVTVVDPNDYIYRASNEHPTTLSEIRQKLVETLGGYLVLERAGATLYLDYLAEPPRVNTQVIRFGENLMTSNKEIRGEELASVIIPLGARLEGTGAGERLTIKSVNGGLDYLVDVTAKEQFGAISQTRVYDDITLASNLKAKGELALADAVKSVSAITVSAIDLSLIDRNIDEFRIMDKVKVVSDAQGLDDEFIIESLTLDLLSPENNKLTVGKEYKSITQNIAKTDTNITQILNTYTSSTEALRVAEEVTAIVDEISQLIKIIDRRVDPNGWYYTEYSDGMVECYKTVVIPPISVWTSDQGGYKAIVDLGLPPSGETMTFRDHIQHSLRDGGRMLTVDIGTIGLPTDEITGTVYSLVDTPSTDIYISVTLIGRK